MWALETDFWLPPEQVQGLTVHMWCFPWASWLVVAAILAVLVTMAFTADLASQPYASLLCTGIAFLAYYLRSRSSARQMARAYNKREFIQ